MQAIGKLAHLAGGAGEMDAQVVVGQHHPVLPFEKAQVAVQYLPDPLQIVIAVITRTDDQQPLFHKIALTRRQRLFRITHRHKALSMASPSITQSTACT